jgi:hypothetical protein
MLTVPLAAAGVLLTLVLTDTTLNLQSGIGCLMLEGIVVNNAILLIDQAGRLRREGLATDAGTARGGPQAAAPGAHDHGHHGPRSPTPGTRHRRRGGCPGTAGAGGSGRAERLGGHYLGLIPVAYSLVHREPQ